MGIGAVLGGAAEGTGQGLGRFSNAILQVLGSMEGRKNVEEYRASQAEESAYRRHRDSVRDTADREAMDRRAPPTPASLPAHGARIGSVAIFV